MVDSVRWVACVFDAASSVDEGICSSVSWLWTGLGFTWGCADMWDAVVCVAVGIGVGVRESMHTSPRFCAGTAALQLVAVERG